MLVDTRVEKARKLVFSANGKFYSIKIAYLSYKKGKPKNFTPTAPIYFGKAFEIPKDFSRKVLCVQVWGGSPNLPFLQER